MHGTSHTWFEPVGPIAELPEPGYAAEKSRALRKVRAEPLGAAFKRRRVWVYLASCSLRWQCRRCGAGSQTCGMEISSVLPSASFSLLRLPPFGTSSNQGDSHRVEKLSPTPSTTPPNMALLSPRLRARLSFTLGVASDPPPSASFLKDTP